MVSHIAYEFSFGIQVEHPYVLPFIKELGGEFGCYYFGVDIGILSNSHPHLTIETRRVTHGVRRSFLLRVFAHRAAAHGSWCPFMVRLGILAFN